MTDTPNEVTVTMVFKLDKSKFRDMNPLTTETPWGIPYAISVGDALEDTERLREQLEKDLRDRLDKIKEKLW